MNHAQMLFMAGKPRTPTMRFMDSYAVPFPISQTNQAITPALNIGRPDPNRRIYLVHKVEFTDPGYNLDRIQFGATVLTELASNSVYAIDIPDGETASFNLYYNGPPSYFEGAGIAVYRGIGYGNNVEVSDTIVAPSALTAQVSLSGVSNGAAILMHASVETPAIDSMFFDDAGGRTPYRQDTGLFTHAPSNPVSIGYQIAFGSYDAVGSGLYQPRATLNQTGAPNFRISAFSVPRA